MDLTFTIRNRDETDGVAGLKFLDDLSAVLPGLSATGLPVNGVCGAGSLLDGGAFGSVLGFSECSLLPAGSCSFTVTRQVHASASPGSYLNKTGDLTANGLPVADPAVGALVIEGVVDSDGDGVLDDLDVCPDTVIPEGVPIERLGINRFALVDGDSVFDTVPPPGGGNSVSRGGNRIKNGKENTPAPDLSFTIEETAGCSCEQIIEAQGAGQRPCEVRLQHWRNAGLGGAGQSLTRSKLGRPCSEVSVESNFAWVDENCR